MNDESRKQKGKIKDKRWGDFAAGGRVIIVAR